MLTLTYGYQKPQNPDDGSQWFPAMETNIQQLNDHSHNGTDSAPLATQAQALTAGASWVAQSNGAYRQLVTLPSGYTYDNANIWVRVTSTGEAVYPKMVKNTSTTFYIYTNDNTALYSVYLR